MPASRKLQEADARELLAGARRLIVAKGKKINEFPGGKAAPPEAVAAMLGPTGNLRAPTIRSGKTLLVGFEEGMFSEVFG